MGIRQLETTEKQYTTVNIKVCDRSKDYENVIKMFKEVKDSIAVNRDGINVGIDIHFNDNIAKVVKDGYMCNGQLYINLTDLTIAVIKGVSNMRMDISQPMHLWKVDNDKTLQEYFDKCLRQT